MGACVGTYNPICGSIFWHVIHPIIDSRFVIIRSGIIVYLLNEVEIERDVST